ncbi:MAG: DMT family transporter [archaeon]|nr:MAG: DMT family transporter [archaeon]
MAVRRGFLVPAALVIVVASFAVNSVITRYLVSSLLVGPFPLTVIRFLSGLLTLQLMVAAFPKETKKARPGGRDLVGALFLGVYAFAISFGYAFIPASVGALVFYGAVVITMTSYSVVEERERLTFRVVLGLVLGLLGILVLTFGGLGTASLEGVALMALTGISWGLYSVYGRSSGGSFGYTYNSFLFFGIAAAALGVFGTAIAGTAQWTDIAPSSLALALYMGTVSTALSYVVWNGVLRKVASSLGGLAQLLIPVVTAVMGVLILAERLSMSLLVGGALVLAGIFTNSSRGELQKEPGGTPNTVS